MPVFTVERTYWVPIFQHVTIEAETADSAMRAVLASDNWDSAKTDYDGSRAEHVTGCWEGAEDYPAGDITGLAIPADLTAGPDDKPGQPPASYGVAAQPFALFQHSDGLNVAIERHDGPTPVCWAVAPSRVRGGNRNYARRGGLSHAKRIYPQGPRLRKPVATIGL